MDWNAFIIPATGIIVELIKQTNIDRKWLPWLAVGFGLVFGAIFALALKADLFIHIVQGGFYGAAAAGIYDLGKSGLTMYRNRNKDMD
jgi:hypothetical protein